MSGPQPDPAALPVAEDDAQRLYEQAPCGYLSISPAGVVIRANQTFLDWTGLRREEIEGRGRFGELLNPGGRIYYETHLAPMLQLQDSVREIALEIVRPVGAPLPVLVNAVLERDPAGEPSVIRMAVFDATERRGYEQELLRARRSAEESEARAVALARTLQQTFVPPTLPVVPGLEAAAVYRPAGDGQEVGGDFYDVFQVTEDEWVIVLGDVSGKGVEAAVVTSLIKYSLRGISVLVRDPSQALHELNSILLAHDTDRFCTVLLLRLVRRGDAWQVLLSSGGHPRLLVWRSGEDPTPVGEPGFLVGVFEDAEFTTSEALVTDGDVLVLYTDGLTEARRGRDDFFGEPRMLTRLKAHGPEPAALTQGLLVDVLEFQDDDARDDIALLGVRVRTGPS